MSFLGRFVERFRSLSRRKRIDQRRRTRRVFLEPLEPRQLLTIFATIGVGGGNDGKEGDSPDGWPGLIGFGRDPVDQYQTLNDTVTITYTVAAGSTNPASPNDYTIFGNGQMVLGPGVLLDYEPYWPTDDCFDEGTESLLVTITGVQSSDPNTSYSIVGNTAVVYIEDNDEETPSPPCEPITPEVLKPVIPACPDCPPNPSAINQASNPVARGGVANSGASSGQSSKPVRYFDGAVLLTSQDLVSEAEGTPWGITRSWTNAPGYASRNYTGKGMVVMERPSIIDLESSNDVAIIANGTTAYYFSWDTILQEYTPLGFLQEQLEYNSTTDEFILTDLTGARFSFYDFSSSLSGHQQGQLKQYTDPAGNITSLDYSPTSGLLETVERTSVVGSTTVNESFHYSYIQSGGNVGLVADVTLKRQVNGGSASTVRKVAYDYYDPGETHGNVGDLKTATTSDGVNAIDTTYYRYYTPADQATGYVHGLKYVFTSSSLARLTEAHGSTLDSISDSNADDYADNYYEYGTQQRVTKEIAQGAGCGCVGGLGTFTFAYTPSSNADGYNSWKMKTVETLPDGNQNIVFTNYLGQVMLEVFKEGTKEWATYYQYDDTSGRLVLSAEPSAVSGYYESSADLLNEIGGNLTGLRDADGKVTVFAYHDGSLGPDGYMSSVALRKGETGTLVPQVVATYVSHTDLTTGVTVYLPATDTVYNGLGGTGALTTTHSYTFYTGTVQVESQTTTTPANDATTVFFDRHGRPTWVRDGGGFIHFTDYDQQSGAIVTKIADVNTSLVTNEPSGWSTPVGAGLHLVTAYEVDALGRVTKETDANNNITYTTYNDPNHEARIYRGWNASTNLPTGPTIVVREDRARSYTEVLAMSATPAVVSSRPTGTESISSLQSLTRTYVNNAAQPINQDEFFSFSGLTYSTAATLGSVGTHFDRQSMGYDARGRQSRFVRGDGTIFRTVYDGLGRPVSEWIGTDDTPVSGSWSPSNSAEMDQLKEYQYDTNGVGDSNLTLFVADEAMLGQGHYILMQYDFRGRLTQTSLPDPIDPYQTNRPTYLTTYDNLDRVLQETDALSNVTGYAYDDALLEITVTQTDPDDTGPLVSPVFVKKYDARGLFVAEKDPYEKWTYFDHDGASRPVKVTLPDPDAGGALTSPVTQYEYDGVGNVRFVTDPLSNITEYVFDKANRTTQKIEADPDAGGSLTSPITTYSYDAAGLLQSVSDPLSRVTSYEYDKLGRNTKTTEADPDGAGYQGGPVTQYTYDGANRVTAEAHVDTDQPSLPALPSAPTLVYLDNGNAGYTSSGFGTNSGPGYGFWDDEQWASAGTGTKWAEWTTSLSAGIYQVAVTYASYPNRATNSPFQVFNGASSLGTIQVNQELTPNDFTADGANWRILGTYSITNGSMKVRLTNNANEFVMADGVRIFRVGDVQTTNTIDDGATGWSTTGTWTHVSTPGSSFGDDYKYATTTGGSKVATWTAAASAGQWRVSVTFAGGWSTNAPYTIKDGSTPVGSVNVDQTVVPSDWVGSFNTHWKVLGVYNITGTSISLDLSNSANGFAVVADAVQFVRVGDLPASPGSAVQLLDDGDPGFATTGSWTYVPVQGYAGDQRWSAAGTGADVATWAATVTPGMYRVAATWHPDWNRASNAPYTVLDGTSNLGTVTVNQEQYPADFTDFGINWKSLGIFEIASTSLSIQLSDNANDLVMADSIRIERVGDLPTNRTTTYGYDLFDNVNLITEADPDRGGPLPAPVHSYVYDSTGRLHAMTDPMGRLTSFGYDPLHRRVQINEPDPDGTGPLPIPFSTFTYDAVGNLKTITDPLSHTTTYDYDDLHRRISLTDHLLGVTHFAYDKMGRMLTLQDSANNTTTWEYDFLGRVTDETNQLNKTRTFAYDAASNLKERIDRLGRKTTFGYDHLNRSTDEKWYDGATLLRTMTFTYDAAGQLTQATDPSATYGYAYDTLGRVTTESQSLTGLTPALQYARTFNAAGSVSSLAASIGGTADFKNTYQYDPLQRQTRVTQKGVAAGNAVAEKRADFAYDASGLVTKLSRYANAAGTQHVASSHFQYDGMGRLAKLVHSTSTTPPPTGASWGTGPLAGYQYAYDAASRIASIDSYLDGLTSYTHDHTDQLTGADHTGQTDEAYAYDANGNRTGGGHTPGTNNQLASDGTYNYTYDDEGNRLTKTKISTGEKEEYTWDHRNRLTKVTFKNSGGTVTKTVDQTYDVWNQWIRRQVDSDGPGAAAADNTFFSHADGQVMLQFGGTTAASLQHRYLWGVAVDQLLADETVTSLSSAGTVLWPLGDHLGTLRDLASYNSGTGVTTIANHRRYDSFGNLISETNAAIDEIFGYTGRMLDDSTGQQNNLHRWYDSKTGEWMSEDPIGFAGGDANLDRYVLNGPISATDPNGLEPSSTAPPVQSRPQTPTPVPRPGPASPGGRSGFSPRRVGAPGGSKVAPGTGLSLIPAVQALAEARQREIELENLIRSRMPPPRPITCPPIGNTPTGLAGSYDTFADWLKAHPGADENNMMPWYEHQTQSSGGGRRPPTKPGAPAPGKDDYDHDHHRLPRQFEEFFESKGLNIEGFRQPLPESEHIGKGGLHPKGYNEAWELWIEKYGEQATRRDVLKQLECLEREFGVPPLPGQ